jgi:hypothetical protein
MDAHRGSMLKYFNKGIFYHSRVSILNYPSHDPELGAEHSKTFFDALPAIITILA